MASKVPLSFNATEIEIVLYLHEKLSHGKKDSYLYKIHKELEKSIASVLGNLGKLEQKGLVTSIEFAVQEGKRAPSRFYTLTSFGKLLAQTLLMRDKLLNK